MMDFSLSVAPLSWASCSVKDLIALPVFRSAWSFLSQYFSLHERVNMDPIALNSTDNADYTVCCLLLPFHFFPVSLIYLFLQQILTRTYFNRSYRYIHYSSRVAGIHIHSYLVRTFHSETIFHSCIIRSFHHVSHHRYVVEFLFFISGANASYLRPPCKPITGAP